MTLYMRKGNKKANGTRAHKNKVYSFTYIEIFTTIQLLNIEHDHK